MLGSVGMQIAVRAVQLATQGAVREITRRKAARAPQRQLAGLDRSAVNDQR
jgi:hypothetical protein